MVCFKAKGLRGSAYETNIWKEITINIKLKKNPNSPGADKLAIYKHGWYNDGTSIATTEKQLQR